MLSMDLFIIDDKSLQIINYPYHCCVVQDFIRDRDFLEGLQSDLLSLEFHEKSNDLYKFLQVCLLGSFQSVFYFSSLV